MTSAQLLHVLACLPAQKIDRQMGDRHQRSHCGCKSAEPLYTALMLLNALFDLRQSAWLADAADRAAGGGESGGLCGGEGLSGGCGGLRGSGQWLVVSEGGSSFARMNPLMPR
jgi:hypothetical protein